jgi:hypothetical protein
MSSKKHKGIFIEGVKGGRETLKMAPTPPATPPNRQKVTDGREVQKLMPTPPPTPKPAVPPTPTQTTPKK